ncbi:MAG TPA: aminodeoxychorismate lyase [Steroidobacteraceae bacterium]|nr:aminodeoxychorismate lyase [Steroidobacteraceae bacterium]
MTTSWVNGQRAAGIAIEDRGLQYGDGLFETITCIDGRPRWLALHLERLRRGCERLELRFDDFDSLGTEIGAHAAAEGRCIMKLILTRGPARRRGYRPSGDETPTRILTRYDWPPESPQAAAGFRVAVSSVTLGVNPLLAGLKHLNRLEQVLAQSAIRAAPLEEVLMLSNAGDVIGGSMSNVFFADDNGLFTPSLADCGVAGVMRRLVCTAAERHGAPVRERRVGRLELAHVREAFLTNVRWGVQSIALLEGRPLAQRGCSQSVRGWLGAA